MHNIKRRIHLICTYYKKWKKMFNETLTCFKICSETNDSFDQPDILLKDIYHVIYFETRQLEQTQLRRIIYNI